MEEIKLEPQELKLINPRRTSLPVRMAAKPIRKKRDRAALGLEITAGVSLALNVIFAVIIYLMIPAVR